MPGLKAPQSPAPRRRAGRLAAALLAVCLALAPALQALAQPAPDPGAELVAVVPTNMAPVFTTAADGSPAGFAVDVLRRVAERAGYRLRFLTTANISQALQLLEQGQAQVLPGMGVSPERAKRFAFTRSFEVTPLYIYFRAQGPAREDLQSLAGRRVALLPDSIAMEFLGPRPDITVHRAETLSQALFDLFTGDADALVNQSERVEAAARAAGLQDKLGRSRKPLYEVPRVLAVTPGRPDVLRRLDAALAEFCDTQEFQDLYTQWHASPRPTLLTPEAVWIIVLVAVLLGGALLTWRTASLARMNRRLRAALSERDQAMAALRLSQERMEALSTLTHMGGADTKTLADFALKEGVRLTGSGMGFLLFVGDERVDLANAHWCLGGYEPPESMGEMGASLAESGLWAQCLQSRTPILVNEYAERAGQKGQPPGHPPIRRFMAVPLVEGDAVAAVLGVANKAAPYDGQDVRQLQLFLSGLWRVLAARNAAESVRRARDYAENLIEGANAMLVGLDREGRTTLFNAEAEKITGYSRAEVLDRDWCAAMLPAHLAENAAAQYRDFMAGRSALPRSHEGQLRTRDGSVRQVSWQNSLVMQDGEITGVISYGIDITEKKQAEAELRRLHRAIENTAEGVLIADADGVVLYANPALERMAGQDRGLAQGASVFDLDLPLVDHHSSQARIDGGEQVWRGTCILSRPAGAPVELEFTVTAVRDADGPPVSYVAVCRDVTEKRQLEHQLWQWQKMEALGTLAGGVAHDFNNLLASIMGFSELALGEAPQGSRSRSYLGRVMGACARARELVRQILSFTRRSENRPQPLDVDGVVAEALKLLEASTPSEVHIDSRLSARVTVLADPSQVHQVVMNLCANAVQAMQGRSGTIRVRTSAGPLPAELAARRRLAPGDYLTLTVEDQGPGIGQEALGRIFDPFFTTKGPGEGTGLGLAVVHGIVTGLGGAVWAESEPGQGARFTVVLPALPGLPGVAPEPRAADLAGGERILLVDDEPDIRELGRQTLVPLGYALCAEGDPGAALDRLLDDAQGFDLLLTDMSMPGMSGLSLAERLRSRRPDLPIVFLTGYSLGLSAERLEALGPASLLPKPFSTAELALAVRQALDARKEGGHAPVHPRG